MKLKPVRRSIGVLLMIDAMRAMLSPAEYARSLQFGNPLMDDILDYFAENPELTKRFAIGEIVLGAWMALGR